MSKSIFQDPTNRIVCIFDSRDDADAAARTLFADLGEGQAIHVLQGDDAARQLDTSAKWFADTDEEMKRFERELFRGHTIVAVSVADSETRDRAHQILKQFGARHITHFGEWITEVLQ
ncbi:MAG: hypothetical protein KDA60_16985 [Planctomycetales bacterium]|nr:hypothetical protein [Planctomycetales bacterium]